MVEDVMYKLAALVDWNSGEHCYSLAENLAVPPVPPAVNLQSQVEMRTSLLD